MDTELIINSIINKITKKNFFLIQDNNIETNNLLNQLTTKLKEQNFNLILLSNKYEPETKIFSSFFNFSKINEFSKISFFINNKHILIEHDNYLKNNNVKITPKLNSFEYKEIFKKKKYNILENEFDCDISNNVLIIKHIEDISYDALKFLNFNLKLIFDKNKFFGGIKLIFIGDLKYKIYKKITIYDLVHYKDTTQPEYNFLRQFSIYTTKQNNYLDKYKNFFLNMNKEKEINFIFFFNAYNLDIDFISKKNPSYLDNYIFISNSEILVKEINKENNDKLNSFYNVIAKDTQDVMFNEINVNLQRYYLTLFDSNLFIAKGQKIVFLKNITEKKIFKGNIGYIKDIILNTECNENSEISINSINHVKVEIKNKVHNIYPYDLVLKEKNKIYFSRLQLPFKSGWCVHTNLFKFLDLKKIVIVLNENTPFFVLDKCFKNSKNLYFKNSFYLTNKTYFKSSMLLENIEKNFL